MEGMNINFPALQIGEVKIDETSAPRGTGSKSDIANMGNKH